MENSENPVDLEKTAILSDFFMPINKKVVRLRELYPDMTGAEIGRTLGISREYVRQILNKNGLETNVRSRLIREGKFF